VHSAGSCWACAALLPWRSNFSGAVAQVLPLLETSLAAGALQYSWTLWGMTLLVAGYCALSAEQLSAEFLRFRKEAPAGAAYHVSAARREALRLLAAAAKVAKLSHWPLYNFTTGMLMLTALALKWQYVRQSPGVVEHARCGLAAPRRGFGRTHACQPVCRLHW
jgi:hypothetical protein